MGMRINFSVPNIGQFVNEYVVSGWKIAPGASVSGGGDLPIGFSIGAETGQFTATNELQPGASYLFEYTFGNVGLGFSAVPVGVQAFPGEFPAGSIGTVLRLPYAPRGRTQELGAPTGFDDFCGAVAVSAEAGAIPGMVGSVALLLLGGRQDDIRSFRDMVIDGGLSMINPAARFINDFKYATLVWATGLSSPNVAAGGTISIGRAWRA